MAAAQRARQECGSVVQVLRAADTKVGFDVQGMHLGSLLGGKGGSSGGRRAFSRAPHCPWLSDLEVDQRRPRTSCRVEEHRDGQESLSSVLVGSVTEGECWRGGARSDIPGRSSWRLCQPFSAAGSPGGPSGAHRGCHRGLPGQFTSPAVPAPAASLPRAPRRPSTDHVHRPSICWGRFQ